MIKSLNHVNVFTCNADKTVEFYKKLGFKPGFRPLGFEDPGIWLYAGQDDYQILHVNMLPPEEFHQLGKGVIGHFGFGVKGSIEEVTAKLNSSGISYTLWAPIPNSHRALYINGPSGEVVEFVFLDEPIYLS